MQIPRVVRRLPALVLACAALAPLPSQALDFVFTDVGSTPMAPQFLSAFQQAGQYWSGLITDPVTVHMTIAFDALPDGVLGSTVSHFVSHDYSRVRAALAGDATSLLDQSAVASLTTGNSIGFMANTPLLASYLDNDGSANNTTLGLTRANAKALGLLAGGDGDSDASITFSTAYIGSFVTGRTGPVPLSKLDFDTVARHEIAHVLGFSSGVDDMDFCAGAGNPCSLGPGGFNDDWWLETLDLFRYSANGLRDARVGGNAYFSVDGGVTSIESFATGEFNGDGWQASHYGPGSRTLMRPYVVYGEAYDAVLNDLSAMDAIGWDLAGAVPEPSSGVLMLAGAVALLAGLRRRG